MNEMTEDDEAKQRAHEVANQSQSLYATSSPTSHQNNKANQRQITGKNSPMIEVKDSLATSERKADDEDQDTTLTAKERLADEDTETTPGGESANQQNVTHESTKLNEHKIVQDRPNHEHQSSTPSRHNRRHHHNQHTQNYNNNNNLPNNHHRKHNQQYMPTAMNREGTAAAAGPLVSAEYLAQLIKDKKQLSALPSTVLLHVPRLIDEEIHRVRQQLFQINDVVSLGQQQPLELPEPEGEFVSLQEKIYVPVDQHPEYNFVGRLLGPRGMTAKQLEQETGCKIMIRGKGSMRDKKKEEQNRGKANWEHLNDDLHVLITVEDTQSRAQIKLGRAMQEVRQLLVPVVDGEDELKKRQLMELAIMNGTYRDSNYNEALSKMLNDVAYRQSQLVEHGSPTSSGQQQLIAATASASSSGSPPTSGPLVASRHFLTHLQHYPSSTTASTNLEGSSGFPSTGSTPNSQHHGAGHQHVANSGQPHPHSRHQSHSHHGLPTNHHHHSGNPHHLSHPSTVAVVAAAAAAAAAQQHQQVSGLPQSSSNHHHLHHAHSHQSPAAAAAAAAAALMSNPTAEANAILYAQQYHDFQHYAAMAAAAAASHQSILPPPPLDYNPHHPHHAYPPPHHHHAAVAQAVAAATAANQQFHRQIAEQQHQQQNAEALANTHEMVNYHQQDQEIDNDSTNNGNSPNDFHNQSLIEESSGVTSEPSSDQQQQQPQQQLQQEHVQNQ